MSRNNMGGGYNPTKAVLDALGTNYVVEKWVSDDGTQKYQRWADGKIEVFMYISTTAQKTSFTFPIAFQKVPVVNAYPIQTKADRLLDAKFDSWSTTGGAVIFTSRSGDIYTVSEFILTAVGY